MSPPPEPLELNVIVPQDVYNIPITNLPPMPDVAEAPIVEPTDPLEPLYIQARNSMDSSEIAESANED